MICGVESRPRAKSEGDLVSNLCTGQWPARLCGLQRWGLMQPASRFSPVTADFIVPRLYKEQAVPKLKIGQLKPQDVVRAFGLEHNL